VAVNYEHFCICESLFGILYIPSDNIMLIVWHHTWWKYYVAYEMGLKIKREKITKNTSLWLENGWKRGKLGRRWRRAEIAGAGKKGWRSAGTEGR